MKEVIEGNNWGNWLKELIEGLIEGNIGRNWLKELIEGNNWHDVFWGKCSCPRCNGGGQNHLGKILMKVREELKQQNKRSSLEE